MSDYLFGVGERVGIAQALSDPSGHPTHGHSGLVLEQGGRMIAGKWRLGYLLAVWNGEDMWFDEMSLKSLDIWRAA